MKHYIIFDCPKNRKQPYYTNHTAATTVQYNVKTKKTTKTIKTEEIFPIAQIEAAKYPAGDNALCSLSYIDPKPPEIWFNILSACMFCHILTKNAAEVQKIY